LRGNISILEGAGNGNVLKSNEDLRRTTPEKGALEEKEIDRTG
jgi:hypothetical protein